MKASGGDHSPDCKCPRCSGANAARDSLGFQFETKAPDKAWELKLPDFSRPKVDVEAVALRAAEAARRLHPERQVNRIELDLFSVMAVLMALIAVSVVVVGILALILAQSPVT